MVRLKEARKIWRRIIIKIKFLLSIKIIVRQGLKRGGRRGDPPH